MIDNNTDFKLLIEVNDLIERYGSDRICNVIDYATDNNKSKELIKVLKKLATVKTKSTNNLIDEKQLLKDEKEVYDFIVNMFNNRSLFPNIKAIDDFASKYGCLLNKHKSRKEKINSFILYMLNNKSISINSISVEVDQMIKDKVDSENKLSKWAELIIKDKS